MMRQNGVRTCQNGTIENTKENPKVQQKLALTYPIEIIGSRSDGCSPYGPGMPQHTAIVLTEPRP